MGNPIEMVLLFNMLPYSLPVEYNSNLSVFFNVKQNMVEFPRELELISLLIHH